MDNCNCRSQLRALMEATNNMEIRRFRPDGAQISGFTQLKTNASVLAAVQTGDSVLLVIIVSRASVIATN